MTYNAVGTHQVLDEPLLAGGIEAPITLSCLVKVVLLLNHLLDTLPMDLLLLPDGRVDLGLLDVVVAGGEVINL